MGDKIIVKLDSEGKPKLIIKKMFNKDDFDIMAPPEKQRKMGKAKLAGGGISQRGLGKAFKKGGRV